LLRYRSLRFLASLLATAKFWRERATPICSGYRRRGLPCEGILLLQCDCRCFRTSRHHDSKSLPIPLRPRATRRGGSRRDSKVSFRDWRHIANDGFMRGSSRQKNRSGGLTILITSRRLSMTARSCEPAPTIRTPSEMDNLVSMGGWIARVGCRDIPGVRCFRHRSACHYRACWISSVFACQRQGCELKKPESASREA